MWGDVGGLSVGGSRLTCMEGTSITQIRAAVSAASGMLAVLPGSVVVVGNAELGPFFRDVDDLSPLAAARSTFALSTTLDIG